MTDRKPQWLRGDGVQQIYLNEHGNEVACYRTFLSDHLNAIFFKFDALKDLLLDGENVGEAFDFLLSALIRDSLAQITAAMGQTSAQIGDIYLDLPMHGQQGHREEVPLGVILEAARGGGFMKEKQEPKDLVDDLIHGTYMIETLIGVLCFPSADGEMDAIKALWDSTNCNVVSNLAKMALGMIHTQQDRLFALENAVKEGRG